MGAREQDVKVALVRALTDAGASWQTAFSGAREVVLFGSRAGLVERPDSDWDVLCIGDGRNDRFGSVQVLWVPEDALEDDRWLGSELAWHVSLFGCWLLGSGGWKDSVFVSPRAIERKIEKICRRLSHTNQMWDMLSTNYKRRKIQFVRRDLQRCDRLSSRQPLPPTPILDRDWVGLTQPRSWLMARLDKLSCTAELDRCFLEEFAGLASQRDSVLEEILATAR